MKQKTALSPLRKALLLLGGLLILVGFNYSVYTKTKILERGAVVRLKLAPVDPRALMTGDYMTLNYDIARKLGGVTPDQPAQDGYVLVQIDAQGVAEYVSHSANYPAVGAQQLALQFRQRGREIKFATNAYYFQEGRGKTFESARYGEFRVSPKGELLLTHLLNESLQRIEP